MPQETFVSFLLTWFQMLPSFIFSEEIITTMRCWSSLRKKVFFFSLGFLLLWKKFYNDYIKYIYNNVKKIKHGQFLYLASSTHLTSSTAQMLTKFSTFNCIYNNNNYLDLLSLHNLFYCLCIAGKLAIPLQMTWIWISIPRTWLLPL